MSVNILLKDLYSKEYFDTLSEALDNILMFPK